MLWGEDGAPENSKESAASAHFLGRHSGSRIEEEELLLSGVRGHPRRG